MKLTLKTRDRNGAKIVGFCRVHFVRTAPPTQRPKGCAIFRLYTPTTQIQVLSTSDGHVVRQMNKKRVNYGTTDIFQK